MLLSWTAAIGVAIAHQFATCGGKALVRRAADAVAALSGRCRDIGGGGNAGAASHGPAIASPGAGRGRCGRDVGW